MIIAAVLAFYMFIGIYAYLWNWYSRDRVLVCYDIKAQTTKKWKRGPNGRLIRDTI